MTIPDTYTFYRGEQYFLRATSLLVGAISLYSAGNEVTGSLNLHKKSVTIPFTLADARFPVFAA
jgi:hypothetical protein